MKSDNNWYGHRKIFAEYIGVKNNPCFSTIQHGYKNRYNLKKTPKLPRLKFVPLLCWNLETKLEFNKIGFKNAHVVGAPFIYLSKILKFKKKNDKNRVLFFPPHNTIDWKIHEDLYYNEMSNKLLKLYKKKKITVCLYYSDFKNKNIVKLFKKKGFKVISIVARNNDKSLKKLYLEILSNHQIIVCDISSVFFYSMFLKKRVKILLKNNKETFLTKKVVDDKKFIFYFKKKYPDLFKKGLNSKKAYQIACHHLGFNYLRSRQELKKLLGWDNKFKMFLAKIFTLYYDIRLSPKFRLGKKV